MLKILTVVVNLEKGGTQRVASNFAEEYRRLGHDSRVLAVASGGLRQRELEAASVPCWIGSDRNTQSEIHAWSPHIIHLHTIYLDEQLIRTLKQLCPEAVVIETNVFSVPMPWHDLVDVSLQLSTWCNWLYHQRASRPGRTAVVPNPVMCDRFQRASDACIREFRRRHGLAPEHFVIGRVGQAYDRKWSTLLVDAFEAVRLRHPDARLLLVNPPESVVMRCKRSALASDAVIIDQITRDDEMSEAYSAMDVFAHVADQGESFGLVLAEALLCQTPVVTMSTPWEDNTQGEVVGNTIGGLVATTRQGFHRALFALHNDPVLRRQLGMRGRERILQKYDVRQVAPLAIDAAFDRLPIGFSSPPSRRAVMELYRDAFDVPSFMMCLCVGRLPQLHLIRYVSGYEPWTKLLRRLSNALLHRMGRL